MPCPNSESKTGKKNLKALWTIGHLSCRPHRQLFCPQSHIKRLKSNRYLRVQASTLTQSLWQSMTIPFKRKDLPSSNSTSLKASPNRMRGQILELNSSRSASCTLKRKSQILVAKVVIGRQRTCPIWLAILLLVTRHVRERWCQDSGRMTTLSLAMSETKCLIIGAEGWFLSEYTDLCLITSMYELNMVIIPLTTTKILTT